MAKGLCLAVFVLGSGGGVTVCDVVLPDGCMACCFGGLCTVECY